MRTHHNKNASRAIPFLFLLGMLASFPVSSSDDSFGLTFSAVPNHPNVLWRASATPKQASIANTETGRVHRNVGVRSNDTFQVKSAAEPLPGHTQISNAIPADPAYRLTPSAPSKIQPAVAENPTRLHVSRRNLDMFVGEVRVLSEQKIARVAIGQGAVLRADVLDSGELLVIAEAAGSSSLRIWLENGYQSDYNIRVSQEDPETRFRMEKMVKMRVRMIEFRKSALTRLGIDWADSFAGPAVSAVGGAASDGVFQPTLDGAEALPLSVDPIAAYFGIASNLTSKINAMAVEGDARILAEPVLSGTNGGVASFLAGGEVPYPTIGANGESIVDFKEYGIRLEVQPRIDAGGNVRANIKTEISQLDPAVTIQGAPGLLTRRATTEVNVRSGQTIVISGLLSSEASNDLTRLPGIGRLPVLGRLFRSDNIRNNVSELVIFITPEVIDPAHLALNHRDAEFYQASESEARYAKERVFSVE